MINITKAAIELSSQTSLLVDTLDELPKEARLKPLDVLRKLQASGN